MNLFIEGHNVKRGYAVSVEYSDREISAMPPEIETDPPVRFYVNGRHAKRVVERFNRRFATEQRQAQ